MIEVIIDSGSTKADWRILHEGTVVAISTKGLNPYFITSDEMTTIILEQVVPQLNDQKINRIHFYGAGCSADIRRKQVSDALKQCFPGSSIYVETDLLAAARAMLKNERGLAAILGTGTNSGLYDGKLITQSIDSLGYFLGDEGSGAAIGKKILRDYLRGILPTDLQQKFSILCPMNREQVLEQLYAKPFPSRFLASFVPFAVEHISHIYIQQLIKESFSEFFSQLIMHYENIEQYPLCFTGSVGYFFRALLNETATDFGTRIQKVIQSPIDELVVYHQMQ